MHMGGDEMGRMQWAKEPISMLNVFIKVVQEVVVQNVGEAALGVLCSDLVTLL